MVRRVQAEHDAEALALSLRRAWVFGAILAAVLLVVAVFR